MGAEPVKAPADERDDERESLYPSKPHDSAFSLDCRVPAARIIAEKRTGV